MWTVEKWTKWALHYCFLKPAWWWKCVAGRKWPSHEDKYKYGSWYLRLVCCWEARVTHGIGSICVACSSRRFDPLLMLAGERAALMPGIIKRRYSIMHVLQRQGLFIQELVHLLVTHTYTRRPHGSNRSCFHASEADNPQAPWLIPEAAWYRHQNTLQPVFSGRFYPWVCHRVGGWQHLSLCDLHSALQKPGMNVWVRLSQREWA